jgi:glyoxylase-like metal-dependent hydrolase (beta-lactamase superfamily II)
MTLTTIFPGCHMLTSVVGGNRLNLYLLDGERTLLVDSGVHSTPETVIFPALTAAGLPERVDLLLISHADADHHGGNAALLARLPNTLVLCHRMDAMRVTTRQQHLRERYTDAVRADDTPFAPELLEWLDANIGPDAPVHLLLSGGEQIWLGPGRSWEVIHTPGHTAGHLALWNAAKRTLIIQDAVLGRGVPDASGKIVSPPPYFDVASYVETINRLRALGAERLLSGHFAPIAGTEAVEAFFAASQATVTLIQDLTIDIVRRACRPLTLSAVCATIDEHVGPYPVAVQWIPPVRAHLEQHAAHGRLRELRGAGPRAWSG